MEDFEAGNYAAASEKLERAYSALKVPSLGLWSARALLKLDRWVEASERLLEVTRLEVSGGEMAVQNAARRDAEADLAALSPRIPSVIIVLRGAGPTEASITLDGRPVAPSLIGAAIPVDPGKHVFRAEHAAGGTESTSEFAPDTASREIVLDLTSINAPGARGGTSGGETRSEVPRRATDGGSVGQTQRTAGLLVAGVGLVGVGVGSYFYFKAQSDNSEARNVCPSGVGCTEGQIRAHADLIDSVNSAKTTAFIGWGVGAGLLVTGAVLYLAAPRSSASARAHELRVSLTKLPEGGYLSVVGGRF